jgi:GNAT superfamily N-acetyltransferase
MKQLLRRIVNLLGLDLAPEDRRGHKSGIRSNPSLQTMDQLTHAEFHEGEFTVSSDPARLDVEAVWDFLSQTYWGKERPRAVFDKSLRHSLCFGVYHRDRQVGFARVITDYGTFGYLADVYILEPYRGRGLGRWLVQCVLAHPEVRGLRRWALVTRDCQRLYRECGFTALQHPDHHMQKLQPYPRPEPG